MHAIDWLVLAITLLTIVSFGVWKTRNVKSSEGFLLGDRDLRWWTIGLSVMATQASAITFLSTPGQAFEEGMGFAQFYFGLPIAMVILCVFFLPLYYRLKVYTAYEYLEQRFDLKIRVLTAILFLISRGLAAGITIFAPSIILSSILGWNLNLTNLIIGSLVIVYTMSGGTSAVSHTQKHQMVVILTGMFVAFIILMNRLPENVGLVDSLRLAGTMGKLEIVDFNFSWDNKYNMWSALFGGTFLFLSYFGTDQSQVQRYLSGKSLTESRLGLLFNGVFKVPMQFFILLVGLLVFVFYQFNPSPIHFNNSNSEQIQQTSYAGEFQNLETEFEKVYGDKRLVALELVQAYEGGPEGQINEKSSKLIDLQKRETQLRNDAKEVIKQALPQNDTEDADYVFITFVTQNLPIGLVGLLLAVIFSAAMSSTASELNALATTSVVDLYKRNFGSGHDDAHYLKTSKLLTLLWGIIALIFATFASLFDNLIEAVNIIGSLFYGTILGIFVVAFFLKWIGSRAVLIAAIIAELVVIITIYLSYTEVIPLAYLWLNLIGCALVVISSIVLQALFSE